MKVGIILVLVLVAGTCLAGYMWMKPPNYGVDADHPLGRFELIDEALRSNKDFEKEKMDVLDLPLELQVGETAYKYLDVKKSEEYETEEVVWVVLDEDGEVVGIGGSWITRQDAWSTYSTSTLEFVIGMYGQAGGTEPDFRTKTHGRQVGDNNWLEAGFKANGVEGVWVRVERTKKDWIMLAIN